MGEEGISGKNAYQYQVLRLRMELPLRAQTIWLSVHCRYKYHDSMVRRSFSFAFRTRVIYATPTAGQLMKHFMEGLKGLKSQLTLAVKVHFYVRQLRST